MTSRSRPSTAQGIWRPIVVVQQIIWSNSAAKRRLICGDLLVSTKYCPWERSSPGASILLLLAGSPGNLHCSIFPANHAAEPSQADAQRGLGDGSVWIWINSLAISRLSVSLTSTAAVSIVAVQMSSGSIAAANLPFRWNQCAAFHTTFSVYIFKNIVKHGSETWWKHVLILKHLVNMWNTWNHVCEYWQIKRDSFWKIKCGIWYILCKTICKIFTWNILCYFMQLILRNISWNILWYSAVYYFTKYFILYFSWIFHIFHILAECFNNSTYLKML